MVSYFFFKKKKKIEKKSLIFTTVDKKKGLEPLDENSVVTGTGIRYKAHNLMNSMIGRRNSRTGLSHPSS